MARKRGFDEMEGAAAVMPPSSPSHSLLDRLDALVRGQPLEGTVSLPDPFERVRDTRFELREGQAVVDLPPWPVPARGAPDPYPASDGYIRDRRTGRRVTRAGDPMDQTGLQPDNPAAQELEYQARLAVSRDEDDEFITILAGRMNRDVEKVRDRSGEQLQRRLDAEAQQKRRLDLEAQRKSFGERQASLATARTQLEELRARRIVQQAEVAAPARTWLRDQGLLALLQLTGDGLLWPFYMQWQYRFLRTRISRLGDATADTRPWSADDRDRMRLVLETDTRVLVPSDALGAAADQVSAELRDVNANIGAINRAVRRYLVARDWRPSDSAWRTTRNLYWPAIELNDAIFRALRLAYANLPGLESGAPQAAILQELATALIQEPAAVIVPTFLPQAPRAANVTPTASFPWMARNSGTFATPYVAGHVNDFLLNALRPAAGQPPVAQLLDDRVSALAATNIEAVLAAEGLQDAVGEFTGGDPVRLDHEQVADYLLGLNFTRPADALAYDKLRFLMPTRIDYEAACTAIDMLLGPLLVRAAAALFLGPQAPLRAFVLPAAHPLDATLPPNFERTLAQLPRPEFAAPIDRPRFYFTTEAAAVVTRLRPGDLVAYYLYNHDALATRSRTSVYRLDENDSVPNTIAEVAARYDGAVAWDENLTPQKLNDFGEAARRLPGGVAATDLYLSDVSVVRNVVLPLLVDGIFVRAWQAELAARPIVLPAPRPVLAPPAAAAAAPRAPQLVPPAAAPVVPEELPVWPFALSPDPSERGAVARLLSATLDVYANSAAKYWPAADWGDVTAVTLQHVQEMAPALATTALLLDIVQTLFVQDPGLQAAIDGAQRIVTNLERLLEQQSQSELALQAQSAEAFNLFETTERLYYPSAAYMAQPHISRKLWLSAPVISMLEQAEEWIKTWAPWVDRPFLTGRAQRAVRNAFATLVAKYDQALNIDFKRQYNPHFDQTRADQQLLEAQHAMKAVLAQHRAPPVARGQGPAAAVVVLV